MTIDWVAGRGGRLALAGGSVEFACHGPAPADAPTLVLLHEGLGSVGLWRDVPAALAEATGWGVFSYSRLGHGRSDPAVLPRPLDHMTREAVNVLPRLLDAIGLRRGVLLGHSDGATIAAEHGGRVCDPRVEALVLIAPHFFTEAGGLDAIRAAKVAYEAGDLRTRLARHHDDPDNAFHGWSGVWLDPDFRDWNVAEVLDAITIPALAIQGRDDEYGTLAQIDTITARANGPVETLIFDGCRHAPHLERPDAVTDAVKVLCARLDEGHAAGIDWPDHMHIPGRNARHAEGAFDAIRADAVTGLSPAALAQTTAFRHGLAFLDAGYFWEAHEVLEPVWLALPDDAPARRFVQGLIQLANARLKARMGRPKAADRLFVMARALMGADATALTRDDVVERYRLEARVPEL